MTAERRQFPRLPLGHQTTLQIHDPRSRGEWSVSAVEATIRDISPEGVGATLPTEHGHRLKPGWRVTVAVPVRGDDLELSGRIVWVSGCNFGVRLMLAVAASKTRRRYAEWVVKKLREMVP